MKTAIIPGFVLIEVEKTEALHADDYVQWHLWFLAPLLIFLTALALHTVLRRRPPQQAASATPKGVLFALAAIWLISACIMTAAIHTLPEWSWITVGGYLRKR